MSVLENGLPTIIHENVSFSCFIGFVNGTIDTTINDQGTNEFPATINVKTNLGGGSIALTLKGNQTIKKKVSGIDIEVTISQWNCTATKLSFHVKAVGKKKIIFSTVSCTVIDKTLSGQRHNSVDHAKKMEDMFQKVEAEQQKSKAQ